jgi:hypothetical protein
MTALAPMTAISARRVRSNIPSIGTVKRPPARAYRVRECPVSGPAPGMPASDAPYRISMTVMVLDTGAPGVDFSPVSWRRVLPLRSRRRYRTAHGLSDPGRSAFMGRHRAPSNKHVESLAARTLIGMSGRSARVAAQESDFIRAGRSGESNTKFACCRRRGGPYSGRHAGVSLLEGDLRLYPARRAGDIAGSNARAQQPCLDPEGDPL